MSRSTWLVLPLSAALLAGCGGSDGDDAASSTAARSPAAGATTTRAADPKREPVDVRMTLSQSGDGTSTFSPPVQPDEQRVTLKNRTRYSAVVSGSSRGGSASARVPAGETVSITWPREPGADRVRAKLSVPGHPGYTRSTLTPVDG